VARAVFHPRWIPESLDPSVEALKRARVIAGAVAALGVYTFVEGGFALTEMLDNAATASAVLFFVTPLTVGVMLYVWRRSGGGSVRQLKEPLVKSLKLLLLFIGSVLTTVLLFRLGDGLGILGKLLFSIAALWMAFFVMAGAYRVSGNFFGTAVVHRCLPPLLASVTSWLMAVPDLVTGDLHGLGLALGVVFILGAPVTVTGISLLEMNRLRSRYGVRLTAHPATLPPLTPPPPPMPPTMTPPPMPPTMTPPPMPPVTPPHGPQQGQPHGNPFAPGPGNPYRQGHPYGPPQGSPYGTPPAPGPGNPYAPYTPQPPHGAGPYGG
jgi:hypothetical protein